MFGRPGFIPLEFIYTELLAFLIVTILCLFIYFKTKEVYSLTSHKGIYYFRTTFLFLALGFLFRFIFLFSRLYYPEFKFSYFGFIPMFFVAYFGSVAILSLSSSLVWNSLHNSWNYWMHIIAMFVLLVSIFTQSPEVMILLQFGLLLFSFLAVKFKKGKFFSNMKIVYMLLFVFWIVNLLVLTKRLINPYTKFILYFVMIGIFWIIAHKVNKRLSYGGKKR